MDSLVAEAQSHLQRFDPSRSSSTTTSKLAGEIDSLRVQQGDAQCVAKLPTELLLLLCSLLQVPRACAGDVEDLEADEIIKRERFQHHAPSLLQLSLSLVHLLPPPSQSSDELAIRARLLLTFGRFTQLEQSAGFSSQASVLVSSEICSLLLSSTTRRPLIHHTLSKTFPPLFKAHPKLNPSTGRVLSRPMGGDNAMMDWYEEGEEDERSWRAQPGLGNVVRVVVSALKKNETEDLWPLLLPPLLAYLDDYHPPNKLTGVTILEALLPRVDSSLLIRTGVGKVFEQSLASSFSSLSSPISPSLVLATHRVSLTLLNLLHPVNPSSSARFDALSTLLLSGIVHLWEFKSGHIALERTAAEALPPLLQELGVGSVRFLNVVVPHLCDVLAGTKVGSEETADLIGVVARALEVTLREGKLRVERWKGVVLSGVGKCWVALKEGEVGKEWRAEHSREVKEVEEALRGVLSSLDSEHDVRQFLSLDPLFAELVKPLEAPTTSPPTLP